MSYPEHDKLTAISALSQAIHDFLEWASADKGLHLAYWSCLDGYDERESIYHRDEGHRLPMHGDEGHECAMDTLHPSLVTDQSLLADHFGIDLAKIEEEKRAMLDWLRAMQIESLKPEFRPVEGEAATG